MGRDLEGLTTEENQARKRHSKHKCFGAVGLVTNPGFSLFHTGSAVCPRDKLLLSLGQTGPKGRSVLNVSVPLVCATD